MYGTVGGTTKQGAVAAWSALSENLQNSGISTLSAQAQNVYRCGDPLGNGSSGMYASANGLNANGLNAGLNANLNAAGQNAFSAAQNSNANANSSNSIYGMYFPSTASSAPTSYFQPQPQPQPQAQPQPPSQTSINPFMTNNIPYNMINQSNNSQPLPLYNNFMHPTNTNNNPFYSNTSLYQYPNTNNTNTY